MNGPEAFSQSDKLEQMDGFEKELMRAMRHVDAPKGFAERIMDRAAKGAEAESSHVRTTGHGAPKVVVMRRPFVRGWMGGAMAAVLAIGVFAGEQVHVRHEKEAMAERQFDTATQITNRALEQAREQLERKGISLNE